MEWPFFFLLVGEDGSYFLDTEDGKEYVELFKSIRLKHILNDQPSVTTIEEDSIIPQGENYCLFVCLFGCSWPSSPTPHPCEMLINYESPGRESPTISCLCVCILFLSMSRLQIGC